MKLISVTEGPIKGIKIIRFAKFLDYRGYFTESFNHDQFMENDELKRIFSSRPFVQYNESRSSRMVVRGLHFQWAPHMGKLVRTVSGRMVDLFVDIRKGSPTFGQGSSYEMPVYKEFSEWIWVPPGFAHGNYFSEDTIIQYVCTGMYSKDTEAGLSPIARDINWNFTTPQLKKEFDHYREYGLMTEKDERAHWVDCWNKDERSDNFKYEELGDE